MMFYNILDQKRLDLLPIFKNFKKDFYLGGGTALVLQIGHRDSVDFDFFKEGDIDTPKLFSDLEEFFPEHHWRIYWKKLRKSFRILTET
ncbi:MAG: nucleotidyl transferase AbiEii/AbiGii toxin family protein [bacterium]|nr:nucleotidyl transferase AbiEii/AbiGii toxin family protein [bacterium]